MNNKLKFEQIYKDERASFHYGWTVLPSQDEITLHFHPEIELTHIVKGAGYRMTGDFSEPFEQGELIIHPSNMPHCWIYNPESCLPEGNRECIVLQFHPDLLQTGISFFPEWEYTVRRILSIQQAVRIPGETGLQLIGILKGMYRQDTQEKLLSLFRVIRILGNTTELLPVGIHSNVYNNISKNMKRMQSIYKYIIEHYKENVSLSGIAGIVAMSPTAFCTFFKRETGKTFSFFLNEYRIEIACNMLKNFPDREIAEIAWECGYNDIPYFNRTFRKIKGMSPGEWRKSG